MYVDEEAAAAVGDGDGNGNSGGSNAGLYACIGIIVVLAGILAIRQRSASRNQGATPSLDPQRATTTTNNPMYGPAAETDAVVPPSAADAGVYESSYEEMSVPDTNAGSAAANNVYDTGTSVQNSNQFQHPKQQNQDQDQDQQQQQQQQQQQPSSADAMYEEVPGNEDDYSYGNEDATYEDVVGNNSDEHEC